MKSRALFVLIAISLMPLVGCDDRRRGDWDNTSPIGFNEKPLRRTDPAPTGYPSDGLNPRAMIPPGYGPTESLRPTPNPVPPNVPGPRPQHEGTWLIIRDPRWRYDAEIPQGGFRDTTLNQTVQCKMYKTFAHGLQDDNRTYVVLTTEGVREPSTREAIDSLDVDFMRLAVSNSRGRGGKYSKTLTIKDGIPCSVLEFQNDARTHWGKCQGFILEGVAYQLVGFDRVENRESVERFFNGFQLLGPDMNPRKPPQVENRPPVPVVPGTEEVRKRMRGREPVDAPPSVAPPAGRGPTGESPRPIPEEPPSSKLPPLKPRDNNFPSMNAPESKVAEPPSEVPQPKFPELPTIPGGKKK